MALEKLDLSMSQGHVLMCLDDPMPMSAIAKRMGFDASHVTALIDRLEERGLIERRPDPGDRRVKRIVVTDAGVSIQGQIRRQVCEGLPPLARLSARQRIELRDLLAAATGRALGCAGAGGGTGSGTGAGPADSVVAPHTESAGSDRQLAAQS